MFRLPILFTVLATLLVIPACGKDGGSKKGGGNGAAAKPAQPDPAELEAKRLAEEKAAREAAEARAAEAKAIKEEIADLESQLESLVAKHKAEQAGLPDTSKLRRTLVQLVRDSARATGIYTTDKKRFEELEKEVQASASAEIKALEDKIEAKEKKYNGILSGAKAERAQADLGRADETQVQKEIRTLREAKTKWFDLTRDVRRGNAGAGSTARTAFKTWMSGDPLRQSVIAKAIPDGKSADSYDYGELDFYLFLELLEDRLERENVAEEKKSLSETDKQLDAMEAEIDALKEQYNAKLSEGGGALDEYTSLKDRLEGEKAKAEGLQRQVEELRATYAEVDGTVERHEAAELALSEQIAAKKKRLAELKRAG